MACNTYVSVLDSLGVDPTAGGDVADSHPCGGCGRELPPDAGNTCEGCDLPDTILDESPNLTLEEQMERVRKEYAGAIEELETNRKVTPEGLDTLEEFLGKETRHDVLMTNETARALIQAARVSIDLTEKSKWACSLLMQLAEKVAALKAKCGAETRPYRHGGEAI